MKIHIHQAKAQQGQHTYKTVQDSASAVSNSKIALHHHREETNQSVLHLGAKHWVCV